MLVFLRKSGIEEQMLLVVVNFEDRDVVSDVNIPAHAFDYLEMKEKKVIATDLLTKEKLAMSLRKDGSVRMEIAARSGRVWKVKM